MKSYKKILKIFLKIFLQKEFNLRMKLLKNVTLILNLMSLNFQNIIYQVELVNESTFGKLFLKDWQKSI